LLEWVKIGGDGRDFWFLVFGFSQRCADGFEDARRYGDKQVTGLAKHL
jgi:hypothetical protein